MCHALDKISKLYTKVLLESPSAEQALGYVKDRGFTDDIITKFGIGYCPTSRVDYIKHEFLTYTDIDKLIDIKHLFKVGKNHHSDRFSGRLMFPVRNPIGSVIGFAARTVTGELPKYLNSSESEVYRKAHMLFGLDLAKESIYSANKAIICEGYTDAMAFHQCGITIAVACGGTHATKHQIAQIARYTNNIYLAFDSDTAGEAVTNNTYRLIKEMGLNVGKIDIPQGKDPAEVLLS